jgi:acyl-CoA synthetase (AMP-forming)/AMP-acid ligase II
MDLPALDYGVSPPSLGNILRVQARAHPEREALRFEERTATYAGLFAAACRVGNNLTDMGIDRGDRIAILAKNSDSFFEVFLGAALVGVVLVPVNWRLSASEIAYMLDDSQARLLLIGEEFGALAADAAAMLANPPMTAGLEAGPGGSRWTEMGTDSDPAITIASSEVALQMYTSGTTGRPKGTLLTHHSLNSVRVSQPSEAGWCRWDETDVCLISMPLFHIGGIGTALSSIYNGARMVIAREFEPARLFDYIENDGITRLFIVPSAMRILLDDPRMATTDLSRLRYVIYGSSPITPQLLSEAMTAFRCAFVQVYGMTETSGTIVALPTEDISVDAPELLRSAGKPLAGVEVAILDEHGNRLPPKVVGEVCIRSQANMTGYWRLPAASSAAFTADGFLRSGDAGYVDDAGYLFIHDRMKDMIISGGENVYAVEVETVLDAHPSVRESAVVGLPDPKWGEVVKAFIVLAEGHEIDIEALRSWTRTRLAAFKVPKVIEAVAALPKNASGKIMRKQLREPTMEDNRCGVRT